MQQPDEDQIEDWAAETDESIAARLEGVKAAQSKTRLTLVTMAVISVMMVISSYNAYLSYDYNWIVEQKCEGKIKFDDDKRVQELTDKLTEHAMKEWATSRTVMISLLGIRVSVDDASVLGTAVLLLFSIWLFLVARRENHTTGFLLRDTDERGSDTGTAEGKGEEYTERKRWLIYHTIISNSLFVTFDYLPNVGKLSGPNSLKAATMREKRGRLSSWGLTIARDFFFLFPVVVAAAVFGIDWLSYYSDYLKDPFSPNCTLVDSYRFFIQSRVFFCLCFIPLLVCCWKSRGLARNTEAVLRDYGTKLLNDLKEKRSPKS